MIKEWIQKVTNNLDYQELTKAWHNQEIFLQDCISEDFELSTYILDKKEFWQYLSKKHPEAFCPIIKSFDDTLLNTYNHFYGVSLGMEIPLFLRCYNWIERTGTVVEVGTGFGATRNYLKDRFEKYIGLDLIPNFDDVIEVDMDNLPNLENIDHVHSSNVFQHLSVRERNIYYKWFYKILKPGGTCFLTNIFSADTKELYKKMLFTYGQITKLQTIEEIRTDIHNAGLQIITVISRFDQNVGLYLKKPNENTSQ